MSDLARVELIGDALMAVQAARFHTGNNHPAYQKLKDITEELIDIRDLFLC